VTPVPRGGYIKSMHLGTQDVLTEEMEIGPGTNAPLNLVVSTNGGVIEGQVQLEGLAPQRVAIWLAPAGKLRNVMSFYRSGVSADDGKFELRGVTPGKYKLFAMEQAIPGGWPNPDMAAQLDGLGESVEVGEGTVQLQPKLIPQDRLREVAQ
jgi:hypothetical protein